MKRKLREPEVIVYSVFCHSTLHVFNIERQGKLGESLSSFLFILFKVCVAVFVGKLSCSFDNVCAVVAVLGQLYCVFTFKNLLISDIERKSEFFYLVACVVDIKFTADFIAGVVKNCGETVAKSTASCVAHMHRPCGVRRDKLDVYFLPLTIVASAVIITAFSDVEKNVGVEPVRKIEIDKSGTCNLYL